MDGTAGPRRERFLLVSRLLLDIDDLDHELAATLLGMMDRHHPGWPLEAMADAVEPFAGLPPVDRDPRVVDALRADPAWLARAGDVMKVWWCGQLPDTDPRPGPEPVDAYLGALVWSAIGAHPPGTPGPFFGEWAYPPGGPT